MAIQRSKDDELKKTRSRFAQERLARTNPYLGYPPVSMSGMSPGVGRRLRFFSQAHSLRHPGHRFRVPTKIIAANIRKSWY